MDLDFTDEQEALQASVREVLAKECPIGFVREVVETGAPTDALWDLIVGLDWTGLVGVEVAIVAEELGRALAPVPYLATVTQFAPLVAAAGREEQRARWLGAVASGTTGSAAVAEDAGTWTATDVRAEARRDGDGWVLRGTKQFVLDAERADELVVAARAPGTSGDDGVSLLVVPRAAVRVAPVRSMDATQPLASVELDGVRVEAGRLLGEPGSAAPALARAVQEATVALALATVGTCQAILDLVLAHAKTREQFGVPIGSFQAVKHKLADMYVAVERARAVGYFAALVIAEDDESRALAAAMAKVAAGECQRRVVQDGLQLTGGIGYTWEHDLHLYLKRAKTGDALLGTAADHRMTVARLAGLA